MGWSERGEVLVVNVRSGEEREDRRRTRKGGRVRIKGWVLFLSFLFFTIYQALHFLYFTIDFYIIFFNNVIYNNYYYYNYYYNYNYNYNYYYYNYYYN